MPNELVFYGQRDLQTPDGEDLGRFRAAPYERIRVLAYCGPDSGVVQLSLVHLEGEGAPGALDRIVLVPGSEVNQTYEVPGVVLGLYALPAADSPADVTVWVWGYRAEPGVPPDVNTNPQPPSESELEVHVVLDDGAGGPGMPAGPGVIVSVGGTEAGVTDENGVLIFATPSGSFTVTAVLPSMAMGTADVTAEPGVVQQVTIILTEDEQYVESDLVLAELVNGGLDLSTPSVTLRLEQGGTVVPVLRLDEVDLRGQADDSAATDLTDAFTVDPQGTIAAVDVATVLSSVSALASNSTLVVVGADARGFTYSGSVTFAPGLFTVQVQLQAPSSRPNLTISDLAVSVRYGNQDPLSMSSDAAGAVNLTQVPGAMLQLSAVTNDAGEVFTGEATIAVNGNLQLLVRLLGLQDVAAGVSPWEITPIPTPVRLAFPAARTRTEVEEAPSVAQRAEDLRAAAPPSSVTVSVSGGQENATATQSATLTVPQGSERVILKYLVSTAEYPTYVLQQSRYNDTWSIDVRDPAGASLFSISRTVNSQLFSPPTWGPFGDTGTLRENIDVSALTAAGDVELTVIARTTNIGDSILPTDVVAVLGAEPKITINAALHDTVAPTHGASDRFSIPRSGERNTFQRTFDLDFTKPDDVEIETVRAELVSGGATLQRVVDDEAVGTVRVQQIDEATMRVVVTFGDVTSTIASTPPPADRISYRFTMKGRSSAGDESTSDPKDSPELYALWRMPDGFARYGVRDVGGDDWASESTYTWLDGHRALVTRIDDVSGEHARDIGHAEHFQGRQVDMFHVFTFPNGAASGQTNYLQLRMHVQRALTGDAASTALVNSWAVDTRARFDLLIAEVQVTRIFYAIGSAVAAAGGLPALADGWARSLLTGGSYASPGGLHLVLPAGVWGNGQNAKLRFNAIHNTHVHLNL